MDISAWGRQGETINQYMTKGRPILIEGRLKYDTWTGQDGQKRSKLSVVADNFQFLGGREGGGGAPDGARYDQGGAPPPPMDNMDPNQGPAPDAPPDPNRIPF